MGCEGEAPRPALLDLGPGLVRMIDFGRQTCDECKRMAPILETLTREYQGRAGVVCLDLRVGENMEVARRFRIRLLPTQVFLDAEGKEVWRHEGFLDRDSIVKKFEEMGVTPPGAPVAAEDPAGSSGSGGPGGPQGEASRGALEPSPDHKATVFLVTASEACECTLKKCQAAEAALAAVSQRFATSIAVRRMDLVADRERADALLDEVDLIFVPAVVLRDPEGRVLFKAQLDIDAGEMSRAIEKAVGGS